jgi:hypothetical protein
MIGKGFPVAIIRPQFPQSLPPTAKPAVDNARAAFFQAALGKAQAVAPVQPRPIPVNEQPIPRAAAEPEPPAAYRRPGSLLDIKV